MKINDLITELKAFADQYGNVDMHFSVHGDNASRWGEEAKVLIRDGNNVTGGTSAFMDLILEQGCKITTSKELKEKRRSPEHHWTAENQWRVSVGDSVNDSGFERRTKRFGNPRNKWSTMTEDNC